jgi:hypothetical protein
MRETDLYLPVKRLLEAQGYTVKGEVGHCDVVAVRGDDPPVIVEMKSAFSLKLISQALRRQSVTDAVYIAIPTPAWKSRQDVLALCRRLGLGLISIGPRKVETELDPAPYQPRKVARRKAALLREFHRRAGDPSPGGSTRQPVVTAYRQDALRCARLLSIEGASPVARIRAGTGVERAARMLQDDVYGWFSRESRGIYGLSEKGRRALITFARALAALDACTSSAAARLPNETIDQRLQHAG